MDTAKTARLCVDHGGPYAVWAAGGRAYAPPVLPLVLIPTTAGTGSEVSGGAVITNESTHIKAGIASPHLRAQHALVDPALTYGLPRAPTRDAGVDALAQAIAGVAVTARTPIGNGVGLEAVRIAATALPAVCADGSDHAARQQMACASLMGGLVMNISDCGSEHSIAQALGGAFGIPHGLTIGLVLAESMDHDRHAVPELFERIADALGEPQDSTGDGSRAVRGVKTDPARGRLPGAVVDRRHRGPAGGSRGERDAGLLHHGRAEPVDAGRRRRLLPGRRSPSRRADRSRPVLWGRTPDGAFRGQTPRTGPSRKARGSRDLRGSGGFGSGQCVFGAAFIV